MSLKGTQLILLSLVLCLTALPVVAAMTLSVAAIPQMLGPEPTNGSEWRIETVDSTGYVGTQSSMALDSNDNPHISYLGSIYSELKYAKWNGTSWNNQTVDYISNGTASTSIAIDGSDNPHISYGDLTVRDLKYAKWNGSSWSIETVDSKGSVGFYNSIDLDSSDNPHIAYSHDEYGDLKYAKWNGSAWNIETVDSAGYVGEWPSIDLDSSDNPHISYYDDINDDLKYAKWNGSAWNIETVDSAGWVGATSSLALDSSDNPQISYYDHANRDLKYAKWNGSAWSIETVDSAGHVGNHNSIAVDSGDNPHIGYYDSGDGDLEYAKWNGSAWNIETVDSAHCGQWPSIALDSGDNPHISYKAYKLRDLKYATKAEFAPERSVTLNIDPDTLNLRSKGKWITAYLTTDNGYAKDIDVSSIFFKDVISPEWWDIQNDTTLMVKFSRSAVQAILPVSNEVDIKIAGQWKDGEAFELHDVIRVIDVGGHRQSPWSIHSREGTLSHLRIESEASSAHIEMEGLQTSLSETDMSAIPVAHDGKESLSHYSSKASSPESCLYRASSIAVSLI